MAIATVTVFDHPLPPRHTPAASASWRLPPRVYSPYPAHRVDRPMAVPAASEETRALSGQTRRSPFRGWRDRAQR